MGSGSEDRSNQILQAHQYGHANNKQVSLESSDRRMFDRKTHLSQALEYVIPLHFNQPDPDLVNKTHLGLEMPLERNLILLDALYFQ